MTTDEDRRFAKDTSVAIYYHQIANGRVMDPFAQDLEYLESLRRGLLGECAFAHEFPGTEVDSALRSRGDGGKDFVLPLRLRNSVQEVKINVKAKTLWSPIENLPFVPDLRVAANEIERQTIYVFGVYNPHQDEAEVLRWQWGWKVLELNKRLDLPSKNHGRVYLAAFNELRDLEQMKRARVI